jgi:prepilin-type N-terminal cleavage/methylation domain-containing protein
MNFRGGFTLIEVLVVITIIGILSGMVLVNLNNARLKAYDASIKLQLASVRREAEIYYTGPGGETYGNNANSCNAASSMFKQDTIISNLIDGVSNISSAVATCRSNGTNFAVSANLLSAIDPTEDNWCIDSTGAARTIADPPAANVPFCP